jgi:hypothetical protein
VLEKQIGEVIVKADSSSRSFVVECSLESALDAVDGRVNESALRNELNLDFNQIKETLHVWLIN